MAGTVPFDVIIAAAGSGSRLGADCPKAFVPVGGMEMLAWAAAAAAELPARRLVVAVPPDDPATWRQRVESTVGGAAVQVVAGGASRQESVFAALRALRDDEAADRDVVLVHDAARPCASLELWRRVSAAAVEHGAAIPVLPATDSLKQVDSGGAITASLDRSTIVRAQTPQGFRLDWLWEAHERAAEAGDSATDDAALLELAGRRVATVAGESTNIKVTTAEDLPQAARFLGATAPPVRVGQGYDIHPLADGRRLVLGGVEIDHPQGLAGHSDADSLAHAVTDALLGAAGMGDIGLRFPADDPQWEGADSLVLLRTVVAELATAGYRATNVDATILAEQPRLSPHLDAMRDNLADCLGLPRGAVNVKATRGEGLGAIGRNEGIAAHAVAVIAAL